MWWSSPKLICHHGPSQILRGNRGFALAETIAATAILTFVLAGLMIQVQYARAKAVVNYHDRYVLMRVDGEMQRKKYQHTVYGDIGSLRAVEFSIPQLNENALNVGNRIPVYVSFSVEDLPDTSVGQNIRYVVLTAVAEWDEHVPLFARRPRAEKRYVQLREDYFYERTVP